MGVIIRQSVKGSIATYLGAFVGYLNVIFIFPFFFSEEEIGIIRFLLEVSVVLTGFTMLGTQYSLVRFYPKLTNTKDKGVAFFIYMIPMIGVLLFIALSFILKDFYLVIFGNKSKELIPYLIYLYPLIAILGLNTVTETYCSVLGRITFTRLTKELVLRIGVSIMALLFGIQWLNFEDTLVFLIVVHFFVLVLNILYLKRLKPIDFSPSRIDIPSQVQKDYFKYTIFVIVASISSVIINKVDFVMVSSMQGMADTGIYSTAFYLALIVEIPRRSILQIGSPIISKYIHDENWVELKSVYQKSSLTLLTAGFILFILMWLNLPLLFHIMPSGESFSKGILVFYFIGLAKLVEIGVGLASAILANSTLYAYSLLVSIVTAVVAIGVNLYLIPIYGINGAAIGTLVSYILSSAFLVFIIFTKLKMHPFSQNTYKLIALAISILLLHYYFPIKLGWVLVDSITNTIVYWGGFVVLVLVTRLSEDFNGLILTVLRRIQNRSFK